MYLLKKWIFSFRLLIILQSGMGFDMLIILQYHLYLSLSVTIKIWSSLFRFGVQTNPFLSFETINLAIWLLLSLGSCSKSFLLFQNENNIYYIILGASDFSGEIKVKTIINGEGEKIEASNNFNLKRLQLWIAYHMMHFEVNR